MIAQKREFCDLLVDLRADERFNCDVSGFEYTLGTHHTVKGRKALAELFSSFLLKNVQ